MEKKSKQRRETGLGETEWPLDDYDDETNKKSKVKFLSFLRLFYFSAWAPAEGNPGCHKILEKMCLWSASTFKVVNVNKKLSRTKNFFQDNL